MSKSWWVKAGNCLERLKELEDNSIDSIVTDPPYGISFMGKKWDYDVPGVDVWEECLRVLKPGGHLLSFSGTKTYHRMAVNIEDAGFEIRDMISWTYSTGFPKSQDVSKAIDKAAGAERKVVAPPPYKRGKAKQKYSDTRKVSYDYAPQPITAPSTKDAVKWSGWGTAIKPAQEPIVVARKPFKGTVAKNVLEYGTGAINIDGCRVPLPVNGHLQAGVQHKGNKLDTSKTEGKWGFTAVDREAGLGRWPANIIHDGSDEVLALFPVGKSGAPGKRRKAHETHSMSGRLKISGKQEVGYADNGSAARFFYCPKTSPSERKIDDGLVNSHPTVKPIALMRYLVRLVTPPRATVLDPFLGSGTTVVAALLEGCKAIGIEREAEYRKIAVARIKRAKEQVISKVTDDKAPKRKKNRTTDTKRTRT